MTTITVEELWTSHDTLSAQVKEFETKLHAGVHLTKEEMNEYVRLEYELHYVIDQIARELVRIRFTVPKFIRKLFSK